MSSVVPQAKLIAALADTMSDSMWADDILMRCRQIEAALREIRKIVEPRRGGDR